MKPKFRYSGAARVFHFGTATAAKLEENSEEKQPSVRTFTSAARRGMLTGNTARMIFEGWRGRTERQCEITSSA